MKAVTEQSIEQVIPEPTPEIHSFVGYNIQLLGELDRECYAELENLDGKEPLLSVSNGERNYIYSFTRAVKAIEKEILSLQNSFLGLVCSFSCALLLSLVVFGLLFSVNGRIPELVPFFGVFLAFVAISSIVHLLKFKYLKKIKELKQKKTLVFTYGQDYIKTKKEEYKKPVVVV